MTQVYVPEMSQPDEQIRFTPDRWKWLSTAADIAVQGLNDLRTELITDKRNNVVSVSQRHGLSRRHFIYRAKSPVGNKFEREKHLSRLEQIEAHRQYVYEEGILKGEIPQAEAEWIDARVKEIKDALKIDFVCDCRMFAYRAGALIKKNQPHDCHGYTLKGVILWRLGRISSSQFIEAVIALRDAAEDPKREWDPSAKDLSH